MLVNELITIKEEKTSNVELKWKIQPKPSGQYGSFQRRGWPSAVYKNTDLPAVRFSSEEDYNSSRVKNGDHTPIEIYIADHSPREKDPNAAAFDWRKLRIKAKTLGEAKSIALKTINSFPEWLPKEIR